MLGFLAANAETGKTLFGFTPLFGLDPVMHEGDRITGQERLLWGQTRLRHVVAGPDGLLYLLTDESRGRVLRLEPAP